jgi:ketosteroid isomerase-like protein
MRWACGVTTLHVTLVAPTPGFSETISELASQVRDSENAFAGTMAKRDLAAFASYIADDAVFFDRNSALRGKAAVVAGWKSLYDGQQAPFSWRSASVEVLESGDLAHSSGPVFDTHGKQTGTFNSIWRREAQGRWRVVFDKGCDVCNCRPGSEDNK